MAVTLGMLDLSLGDSGFSALTIAVAAPANTSLIVLVDLCEPGVPVIKGMLGGSS